MKNMTIGNPAKLLAGFTIPILVGSLFQQIYSFVDVIIVGRFLGEEALAAVGSTNNLTFFLLSLIFGLSNGAGVIVSQYYGAGRFDNMRRVVTAIIWISAVLSLIISLCGVMGVSLFLHLLSVPENIIGYAADYLRIIFLFAAGSVAFNVSSSILRSMGDSKTPLYALILASLLNVVLDILFISTFHMGVAGAAIATVISQCVSALYCILYLIKKKNDFHLCSLPKLPEKHNIMQIFKIGVPTSFQSTLISLGGMSVQRLVNSFGPAVMAAYASAGKIDGIAIQVIVALGVALSVFTGQNIGQRRFDRITKGLHSTLIMSISAAVIIAGTAFWGGEQIMSIFLDPEKSSEAIKIGAQYLSIMGIAYVVCGIMQSYQNIIRGAGDANTCLVAGITELAGRIFFAYLLSPFLGILGIWIATPLSWACGCIVPVLRYYSGKWKNKIVT
jgi:putative MATE family efflux protein